MTANATSAIQLLAKLATQFSLDHPEFERIVDDPTGHLVVFNSPKGKVSIGAGVNEYGAEAIGVTIDNNIVCVDSIVYSIDLNGTYFNVIPEGHTGHVNVEFNCNRLGNWLIIAKVDDNKKVQNASYAGIAASA